MNIYRKTAKRIVAFVLALVLLAPLAVSAAHPKGYWPYHVAYNDAVKTGNVDEILRTGDALLDFYSNYEMNFDTMAIIPINSTETKVIEKEGEYIINLPSMKIIDNGCRFFGSSYVGRSEGTKSMIGINYKAPIIVEETTPIIFFPTISSYNLNIVIDFLKKFCYNIL